MNETFIEPIFSFIARLDSYLVKKLRDKLISIINIF